MPDPVTDCTDVTDEAAVTRWLRKMTGPAPLRGHAYVREGTGAWCGCGHYLGGLAMNHDYFPDSAGKPRLEPGMTTYFQERHQLHLTLVHNQRRMR